MSCIPHACRALVLAVALSACAAATHQPATATRDGAQTTLTGSGGVNAPLHRNKPYVILISLDGFKAEYLDRFELPNLRRLAQRDARAKSMVTVFPSLTFPNHYSLVTGLHPQRHGIVSNRFYDPARKATYALGDVPSVTDGSWYGGEPIWVTAESQGMVTACYFWPGSEAEIKGVLFDVRDAVDGEADGCDGIVEIRPQPSLDLASFAMATSAARNSSGVETGLAKATRMGRGPSGVFADMSKP